MDASRRSLIGVVAVVAAVALAAQWFGDRRQRELGDEIARLAQPGDIRMVSSLSCPFCTEARLWMERHGVPFEECFIERDAACEATYESLAKQATPTLIVRGQVHTGFDAARVLRALQAGAG
ncbi:glutaredoxin family protein [Calidifontimicrobium sp. SYSU G02091]|uniref:glutaredoxin family protein n=1 Tax=Calidifontimicrobium sp. SYSU G02091 TaxID=2926421 RepID=UPI001F532EFD|nr:glutaredoxin family protein [Calidifontimicrobium sp. SYSU G02091]MCI1192698.1 glutaredoxin family protein [Calidifontimicrobium sp. SYSU G02091]